MPIEPPFDGELRRELDCLFCSVCGHWSPAEQPFGADSGDDERLCGDCGTAVFLDPVAAPVRASRTSAA